MTLWSRRSLSLRSLSRSLSTPHSTTTSHTSHTNSHNSHSKMTTPPPPTITLAPVDPNNVFSYPNLWSSIPPNPSGNPPKAGSAYVFYAQPAPPNLTVLSSLGPDYAKPKTKAPVKRELVRKAVGGAIKQAKALGESVTGSTVVVDVSQDPHAAAVAANLAAYDFTLKTEPPSSFDPRNPSPPGPKFTFKPTQESKEWDEGVVYAYAQNLARTLMELPANIMSPTAFTKRIQSEYKDLPNTQIFVHDEEWAAQKGMNSFLSVTKGTSEPAKFLEIHYNGSPNLLDPPIVLVGKGITFDTGGISIKPSAAMKLMRGDMGGAAAVCSAGWAIAKLGLPVNLVVLTPLTENMPGPAASRPGDVVYAMNGKSIEIDNTDAEGRLVLADALWYGSTEFKPKTIIDVATLTGAVVIALGEVFTGVFTNSDSLWSELETAGLHEHDRFWRLPLTEDFAPQITGSNADLCNTGGRPAGSCTAALFLKSFVNFNPTDTPEDVDGDEPQVRWAHLDIAGTMEATRPWPYLEKGMTGSGTRALIEWVKRSAQV